MKITKSCLMILVLSVTSSIGFPAEEGMWPISEIHKLNLGAKGLMISPGEIFSPTGESLIYAVVQVGATGSFVSPEGLIVTNHHVAYRPVQAASTAENDYIRNGFLARVRSNEIPAQGMTARITESFQDVSEKVLSAVKPGMSLSERTKAIEKAMNLIVAEVEKRHPDKRAEVSEMFRGRTYVLFIYTYLRDIRLVYVPPRSIGEFGGEVDNWMWPRHTGDFSFLRAYAAPDGSPADYSTDNVPFKPKRFLRINPAGANDGDFVFMLGYPGRTYRHTTSHFLAYEEDIRMPYVADWYAWQISVMEEMGEADRAVAIRHLSRIKGLSNTMKNYRGKLRGLERLDLVGKRRMEEAKLQSFIEANPVRKADYADILGETQRIYREMRERADQELVLNYLARSANLPYFAFTAYEAALERPKPDLERKSSYMDRNLPRTLERLRLTLADYFEPTDKVILKEMLMRAARLPQGQRIPAVDSLIAGRDPDAAVTAFIQDAYQNTKLTDEKMLMQAMTKSEKELLAMDDPFIDLAAALYPSYQRMDEVQKTRQGALDQLYAKLIDVKQEFLKTEFIPDANSTLRLTYGRIRGYTPRDAVTYTPVTSLEGVIEKSTGEEPFDTPQKIFDLHRARDFGRFEHPELKSVPVCILYDMDTTGGNSGSPVLNARGELVGINFDRAWEATINDYAWSQSYSRSIGVDIRYVLWITEKFGGVTGLLDEMGIR